MNLTVIGSGTVAPAGDRVAPGHWVTEGSVRLLLDCGAGVLHRAAQLGIPWERATHVAITHFHVDHWGELPHLLFALRWGTVPPRAVPLTLMGPRGIDARLSTLAEAIGRWVREPEYGLDVIELVDGQTYELAAGITLESCKTPHTEESLAYAVRAGDRRIVYTGDTGPSDALAAWARGADLLVAECSLPESHAIDVHLTPRQAGRLARMAGARRLVLTHLYPVYGDIDAAAEAAAEFDGEVAVAADGDRFTIEVA